MQLKHPHNKSYLLTGAYYKFPSRRSTRSCSYNQLVALDGMPWLLLVLRHWSYKLILSLWFVLQLPISIHPLVLCPQPLPDVCCLFEPLFAFHLVLPLYSFRGAWAVGTWATWSVGAWAADSVGAADTWAAGSSSAADAGVADTADTWAADSIGAADTWVTVADAVDTWPADFSSWCCWHLSCWFDWCCWYLSCRYSRYLSCRFSWCCWYDWCCWCLSCKCSWYLSCRCSCCTDHARVDAHLAIHSCVERRCLPCGWPLNHRTCHHHHPTRSMMHLTNVS